MNVQFSALVYLEQNVQMLSLPYKHLDIKKNRL